MSRPIERLLPQLRESARNISYRDFPLNLLAGIPQRLPVSGDYYQVITSDGAITLEFDQGVKVSRFQGMGGPASYTAVTITSAIDQAVVVSLGRTDGLAPYDGRANVVGAVFNVVERVPNTITPLDDVQVDDATLEQLAALGADRMGLWVTIPIKDRAGAVIDSQDTVRIGDSTTAAGKGSIMYPGDTRYFPGTNALYAFNDLGVNIDIAVAAQRYV